MNISKNLLSLGLIAVISGISTAQTYTATAGTNGATDIQSDYSMSTGDGASVSVDVPLEFELPKKVAIAIKAPDGTFTTNSLFAGLNFPGAPYYATDKASISGAEHPAGNISNESIGFIGGIYANTSISVTLEKTDFIHESDPNSVLKDSGYFGLGPKNATNWSEVVSLGYTGNDIDSSTTVFPATLNLADTALAGSDNLVHVHYHTRIYMDTIDPTDRAGKYTQIATVTVNTL